MHEPAKKSCEVIRMYPLRAHWKNPKEPRSVRFLVKIRMGRLEDANWLFPMLWRDSLPPALVLDKDLLDADLCPDLGLSRTGKEGQFKDDAFWGLCFQLRHPDRLLGRSLHFFPSVEPFLTNPKFLHEQPEALGIAGLLCTFPDKLPDTWNDPPYEYNDAMCKSHPDAWCF